MYVLRKRKIRHVSIYTSFKNIIHKSFFHEKIQDRYKSYVNNILWVSIPEGILTSYSLVFDRHHANNRSLICTALSRTAGSVNLNRNSVAGDFRGLDGRLYNNK